VRAQLEGWGIPTISADLADRRALAALPDAPNVVYMAGQKFGTAAAPTVMWGMNAVVPMHVAERYAGSRIVAFSTGNVYPRTPTGGRGAAEDHALTPVGEYANSCVARERVLDYVCTRAQTPLAIVRLSYAVDLRYGVLVDVASRVRNEQPVDVRTGFVNVIWQGDANAQAIRCLPRASSPPFVLNVTGPDALSVRELATRFGWLFKRRPRLVGETAPDALLSDTSRAQRLFGPPGVSAEQLIAWVADWLAADLPLLGKPTGFEVRDGKY
jgi:nucleoside-diphosphate-sugar epimerase